MTAAPSERARVRRGDRAAYQPEVVNAILDEGLICHLGVVVDGSVVVLPTGYGRDGGTLFLHGSTAARTLRALRAGAEVCVTVTLLDGLVLARSAFHHSMNYRSVVLHGRAREVVEQPEKRSALEVLTEHLVPGRVRAVRAPTAKELAATAVFALSLDEASAKVRTGPPVDDPDDYALDVWAGVVPLTLAALPPQADPQLPPGTAVPAHATEYRRPGA